MAFPMYREEIEVTISAMLVSNSAISLSSCMLLIDKILSGMASVQELAESQRICDDRSSLWDLRPPSFCQPQDFPGNDRSTNSKSSSPLAKLQSDGPDRNGSSLFYFFGSGNDNLICFSAFLRCLFPQVEHTHA